MDLHSSKCHIVVVIEDFVEPTVKVIVFQELCGFGGVIECWTLPCEIGRVVAKESRIGSGELLDHAFEIDHAIFQKDCIDQTDTTLGENVGLTAGEPVSGCVDCLDIHIRLWLWCVAVVEYLKAEYDSGGDAEGCMCPHAEIVRVGYRLMLP